MSFGVICIKMMSYNSNVHVDFFSGCQPLLKKEVELRHNCVNTNNSCLLATPLKVFYRYEIKRFNTLHPNETQKETEISVINSPGQLLIVSATYKNCHVEDRYDGYKPEHHFFFSFFRFTSS